MARLRILSGKESAPSLENPALRKSAGEAVTWSCRKKYRQERLLFQCLITVRFASARCNRSSVSPAWPGASLRSDFERPDRSKNSVNPGNQGLDSYFQNYVFLFRSSRTGAFEFNSTTYCSRSPRRRAGRGAWPRRFADGRGRPGRSRCRR